MLPIGKGARIEIEDLRETVPDRDGSGKIKKNANLKKKARRRRIFLRSFIREMKGNRDSGRSRNHKESTKIRAFFKEIPTFFVSISEIHILNESLFVIRAM